MNLIFTCFYVCDYLQCLCPLQIIYFLKTNCESPLVFFYILTLYAVSIWGWDLKSNADSLGTSIDGVSQLFVSRGCWRHTQRNSTPLLYTRLEPFFLPANAITGLLIV